MAWQLHYATVNGKTVVTSEPHEVPDDAPVGHVTPLDGHSAVVIPNGILNANRGKDYLGREVRTRILSGVRRLTSLLPGPATLTWAEANRHRIILAFEDQRRAVMPIATFYIRATKHKPPSLTDNLAPGIILFYAALLKIWDEASVTDEHRELILEIAESWDDCDAEADTWYRKRGTEYLSSDMKSLANNQKGVIYSPSGFTLKTAYPALFISDAAPVSPGVTVLLPGAEPPWRIE